MWVKANPCLGRKAFLVVIKVIAKPCLDKKANLIVFKVKAKPCFGKKALMFDLKVKAKMHTDNLSYYPSIDMLRVTALKKRMY